MFPATTKGGGQCLAFPDVCKTPVPGGPPVPIPYPNIVSTSGAKKVAKKVKMKKKPVVTERSKVKSSKGDELGTMKGLISNKHRSECLFKKYSSKVYAQKKKIVHLTGITSHNKANNPAGANVKPSQTKVMVSM